MTIFSKQQKEPDIIKAVSVSKLEKAIEEKGMDPGTTKLLEKEKAYIKSWRVKKRPPEEQGSG